MILFINPLLPDIHIYVIHKNAVEKILTIPKGDDFSSFPERVIETIHEYQIEEIWTICGPGAFTRMRIITLCINTIAMTNGIIIKGCHFFELITKGIPILQVNNTEYIVREGDEGLKYKTFENLIEGEYSGYLIKNDFTERKVFIQYTENWEAISQLFHSLLPEKSLNPLYFKTPHITTGSKKNTFPS